jgi:hypothetical protein
MNTRYHYNGKVFASYADLCNAYHADKGYYPAGAYKQAGPDLYYK